MAKKLSWLRTRNQELMLKFVVLFFLEVIVLASTSSTWGNQVQCEVAFRSLSVATQIEIQKAETRTVGLKRMQGVLIQYASFDSPEALLREMLRDDELPAFKEFFNTEKVNVRALSGKKLPDVELVYFREVVVPAIWLYAKLMIPLLVEEISKTELKANELRGTSSRPVMSVTAQLTRLFTPTVKYEPTLQSDYDRFDFHRPRSNNKSLHQLIRTFKLRALADKMAKQTHQDIALDQIAKIFLQGYDPNVEFDRILFSSKTVVEFAKADAISSGVLYRAGDNGFKLSSQIPQAEWTQMTVGQKTILFDAIRLLRATLHDLAVQTENRAGIPLSAINPGHALTSLNLELLDQLSLQLLRSRYWPDAKAIFTIDAQN